MAISISSLIYHCTSPKLLCIRTRYLTSQKYVFKYFMYQRRYILSTRYTSYVLYTPYRHQDRFHGTGTFIILCMGIILIKHVFYSTYVKCASIDRDKLSGTRYIKCVCEKITRSSSPFKKTRYSFQNIIIICLLICIIIPVQRHRVEAVTGLASCRYIELGTRYLYYSVEFLMRCITKWIYSTYNIIILY